MTPSTTDIIKEVRMRSCRYGSRVRLHNGQVVTVIGFGQECDFPVIDYVTQQGEQKWCWESQIEEVIAL